MKGTFLLRNENRVAVDAMSNEDAGALFKAILAHADGEAVDASLLPPTAMVLFLVIEQQINKAEEAYTAMCERNAENARKKAVGSGRKRSVAVAGENIHPQAVGSGRKHNDSDSDSDSDNDSDSECDSDNESPNGDIKETYPSDRQRKAEKVPSFDELFLGTGLEKELVKEAWDDWVAMRKKIRKPVTEGAAKLAVKKLLQLSGGDSEKAIEILDQSTFNSWQGLFELKDGTFWTKPESRKKSKLEILSEL